MLGDTLGDVDGPLDGAVVGADEGEPVGADVGALVGALVGVALHGAVTLVKNAVSVCSVPARVSVQSGHTIGVTFAMNAVHLEQMALCCSAVGGAGGGAR